MGDYSSWDIPRVNLIWKNCSTLEKQLHAYCLDSAVVDCFANESEIWLKALQLFSQTSRQNVKDEEEE